MQNKGFLIAVSLLQFNLLKNIIFPDFISLTFCLEIPQQLQIGRDCCCAKGGLCKYLSLERLVPEVTRVVSKHQRIKCILSCSSIWWSSEEHGLCCDTESCQSRFLHTHCLSVRDSARSQENDFFHGNDKALVQATVVKDVLSLIQILAAAIHTGWY